MSSWMATPIRNSAFGFSIHCRVNIPSHLFCPLQFSIYTPGVVLTHSTASSKFTYNEESFSLPVTKYYLLNLERPKEVLIQFTMTTWLPLESNPDVSRIFLYRNYSELQILHVNFDPRTPNDTVLILIILIVSFEKGSHEIYSWIGCNSAMGFDRRIWL